MAKQTPILYDMLIFARDEIINTLEDNSFEFNTKLYTIINYAFEGIRAAIIILMFEAILKLAKPLNKNAFFYSLLIISFILNLFFKVNAIFLIITGIILGSIKELLNRKKAHHID